MARLRFKPQPARLTGGKPRGVEWLLLGLLGFGSALRMMAQGALYPIVSNGPASNRINLVLLAEGYTSVQRATFLADATNVVNNLLARPPFQTYRGYFNASAIFIASSQSGSDHPSQSYFRDTYFNSTYDSYGINQLVTIPPNDRDADYTHGQGRVEALLGALAPQYDMAILVVNDLLFGGSGGGLTITSKSSASSQIVAHESGHSFAGLGDEYGDPFPAFSGPEESNTTRETRRGSIKWKAWISPDTPIPTPPISPYAAVVGLFEGAHYQPTNWFRPKLDCMMRTVGRPFCEVCSEALVKAIYRRVRLVDGFFPAGSQLVAAGSQPLRFEVSLVEPAGQTLAVRWLVNQAVQEGADGVSLMLSPWALGNGVFQVRCEICDRTSLVRDDPEGLLRQVLDWQLEVRLPVVLKLEMPGRLPDGRVRIGVAAPAPQGFILQGSADLATWEALATNATSVGSFEFTAPGTNRVRLYFRGQIPGH